ncbi:alpha/beta-hydrolase [Thozetella sp. PMI_491]|nr:alpha/beta-hydrolase [Thozetella sp. PMI_491]
MHLTAATTLALGVSLAHASPLSRQSIPIWETLPPTPALPSPITNNTTPIHGVKLWMQEYNQEAGGTPVVMIAGGLGYSAYFGDVISRLIENKHFVIAVDRRGHGRSTYNLGDIFTYDMFAGDTFDLLKAKGIDEFNVVGWSDGGITTLAALMNSTISPSIKKAFVFGASAKPDDTNSTFSSTAIFNTFVTRCASEYATLQPTANFTDFATKVSTLESTLPQFSDENLAGLDGNKITIAGAEHDEAVNLDVAAMLNSKIKGSKLVTLTGVSHFAPLQDPDSFTKAIEESLA